MFDKAALDARGEEVLSTLTPSSMAAVDYIVTYADYATDEDGAAEVLKDGLALRVVKEESVIAAEAFLTALQSVSILYPNDDDLIGAGSQVAILAAVQAYREKNKPAAPVKGNLADQKIRSYAKWAGIHTTPRLKSELRECYAHFNRNGETDGWEARLDRSAVRADAQSRGLAILS